MNKYTITSLQRDMFGGYYLDTVEYDSPEDLINHYIGHGIIKVATEEEAAANPDLFYCNGTPRKAWFVKMGFWDQYLAMGGK